jgi:hypothetical protein
LFIVQASEKNSLNPHKGAAWACGGQAHAAPMGLERIAAWGVAINISPRWGAWNRLAHVQDGPTRRSGSALGIRPDHWLLMVGQLVSGKSVS